MFQAPQERSEPSFTPDGSGELKARKPVCSDNDEEILFGAKFKLSPSCSRRGCISKGKKRRAFAMDGPLGTLDLHGGDVSNEPAMFYSSDELMSENKLIASSHQDDSGPAEKSQASPPPSCSPRCTPMMTPRQDLFASPVINELSRFGSLALQSSPSSCFSAFSPRHRSHSTNSTMNDQSPSFRDLSSFSIPRQAQRNVPIAFVGSDKSNTPRIFPRNKCPPYSPGNTALHASPKPRLTPRAKDNNKATGLLLSPRFSSGFPCKEMTPPIAFLDLGKIEKDAAAGKTTYNHHQSLLSPSNEVDDFAFVFNSASDGSLTDDDDEGGWFFLRGPDNKDSTEDTKKAKNEHFSSPFGGVDRKQSSFNERIRVPTSLPSAGEQGNVVATLVSRSSSCNSRYSSSSCSSLFGMGIVHEHSQQSLADMGIRRFSPNLSHDKAHQMQNVTGRDLITPPVICTQASEPPEFKPKIRKTMIS
mmetsp:Transcript_15651/g.23327  ORF Transcript_15651/g.23327 Transcript_15651/m.23327 type:complete len:473 (-) Transcript_15651:2757-4175(-)